MVKSKDEISQNNWMYGDELIKSFLTGTAPVGCYIVKEDETLKRKSVPANSQVYNDQNSSEAIPIENPSEKPEQNDTYAPKSIIRVYDT